MTALVFHLGQSGTNLEQDSGKREFHRIENVQLGSHPGGGGYSDVVWTGVRG